MAAIIWAVGHGGECVYIPSEQGHACYGVPGVVPPGHGGVMLGNSYVTPDQPGSPNDIVTQPGLFRHEFRHSDQAAYYGGVAYSFAYQSARLGASTHPGGFYRCQGVVCLPSTPRITGGDGPADCNIFEQYAGYREGNYTQCLGSPFCGAWRDWWPSQRWWFREPAGRGRAIQCRQ